MAAMAITTATMRPMTSGVLLLSCTSGVVGGGGPEPCVTVNSGPALVVALVLVLPTILMHEALCLYGPILATLAGLRARRERRTMIRWLWVLIGLWLVAATALARPCRGGGRALNRVPRALARISQTGGCIGAENLRKVLCSNNISQLPGAPRCRQSVRRRCSNLKR